jgi:DNA polymerase delta subunit 3
MLYEFYTRQNAKKPRSIHATYLLTGKKRISAHTNGASQQDGDDTIMPSSPFMSSLPPPQAEEPTEELVPKTSIILVRQEELESTHHLRLAHSRYKLTVAQQRRRLISRI